MSSIRSTSKRKSSEVVWFCRERSSKTSFQGPEDLGAALRGGALQHSGRTVSVRGGPLHNVGRDSGARRTGSLQPSSAFHALFPRGTVEVSSGSRAKEFHVDLVTDQFEEFSGSAASGAV